MAQDFLQEWLWLEDEIKDIPHAVVGGMAVNQFAPPRATKDLDIAVTEQHYDEIVAVLTSAGFTMVGPLSIGGCTLKAPNGQELDVLLLEERWAEYAITHPHISAGFPIIDLPFLIMMKMVASRATDLGDVQRMLHGASPEQRNRVKTVFRKYSPNDVEDLEQLILLADHAW